MVFLVLLFLILSVVPALGAPPQESHRQVWSVGDRRWTSEEEHRFGQWVEANVKEDFFIRYKIPVDCADVPYAIRWIYARIAALPAAANTKNGKFIGHWSTEWGHLPTHELWHQDRRFRKALFFMLTETTTRTVPLDTYPIWIDPYSVTPGTAFFVTESHSGVIGSVVLDGSHAHPLQTWESTVPAKIQQLKRRSFLSPRPESTTYSGLVKFRWPVFRKGRWEYLPKGEHPFYSEEQYASTFDEGHAGYVDAVAKRIDPKEYDPWEKVERVIDTTVRYLQERVLIVREGFEKCRQGDCPEGSDLWEDYSTPGRDGNIILLMDHLHQIIDLNHLDPEVIREQMEAIPFDITEDRSITFHHLFQTYLWLSPHPEDSIDARWGLRKCEIVQSQIASAMSSIDFIERSYRSRDPRYADFSVRQQKEIIKRLHEEWERSVCVDGRYKKWDEW
jgi:hypothetical protein